MTRQLRTLLDHPLYALVLINLHETGRITRGLRDEALADPKLAKLVVRHEAMHDLHLPNCARRGLYPMPAGTIVDPVRKHPATHWTKKDRK